MRGFGWAEEGVVEGEGGRGEGERGVGRGGLAGCGRRSASRFLWVGVVADWLFSMLRAGGMHPGGLVALTVDELGSLVYN